MAAVVSQTCEPSVLHDRAAPVSTGFEGFYAVEYQPMVRLARALVDTGECAEEIVQHAFVKVYERWGRIHSPGAYLRTAVVNGARSELRKREVRRRVGLKLPRPEAPGEREFLLDALDRLGERRRTALVLRYWADMSERDIAQAMGVRPGTVKSLLSRGLADLRRVLEP